ncbi:MAG: putative molybdenum carrier protein [Candidatus Aminicenantes bacterium]|nr:putative molybdenum carrier protein [Candidatus Aminicenantes bacterium]
MRTSGTWPRVLEQRRNLEGWPNRIVSGGQTGVDRAALDVALELSFDCGGWCPRGRRAEDGPLDSRYPLRETPLRRYGQRTDWNVRDSDGTLILFRTQVDGGTRLTWERARSRGRPCRRVDLDQAPGTEPVMRWIRRYRIRVLNVAGPRESSSPGVYDRAKGFLVRLLEERSDRS